MIYCARYNIYLDIYADKWSHPPHSQFKSDATKINKRNVIIPHDQFWGVYPVFKCHPVSTHTDALHTGTLDSSPNGAPRSRDRYSHPILAENDVKHTHKCASIGVQ
jgi:hypothetical protein